MLASDRHTFPAKALTDLQGDMTTAQCQVILSTHLGDMTEDLGPEGPRKELGDEHEALAAKLLEDGLKLDMATLAAAAAGLRDTSVLESQLKRSREVGHPAKETSTSSRHACVSAYN